MARLRAKPRPERKRPAWGRSCLTHILRAAPNAAYLESDPVIARTALIAGISGAGSTAKIQGQRLSTGDIWQDGTPNARTLRRKN